MLHKLGEKLLARRSEDRRIGASRTSGGLDDARETARAAVKRLSGLKVDRRNPKTNDQTAKSADELTGMLAEFANDIANLNAEQEASVLMRAEQTIKQNKGISRGNNEVARRAIERTLRNSLGYLIRCKAELQSGTIDARTRKNHTELIAREVVNLKAYWLAIQELTKEIKSK